MGRITRNLQALLAMGLLVLAGCMTPVRLNTESGKPEVFIAGISKKEVTDALVDVMVRAGLQVRSVSEYQAEFTKPKGEAFSMVSEFFRGPVYGDIQHEDLLRFTLLDRPGGVYIIGQQFWLERPGARNPGAAVERPSVNQRDIQSMQDFLNALQSRLDSRIRRPTE